MTRTACSFWGFWEAFPLILQQHGTTGITAAKDSQPHQISGFHFVDVFRQGNGATGTSRIAPLFYIHQETFFRDVRLPGNGFDNPLVGLVG